MENSEQTSTNGASFKKIFAKQENDSKVDSKIQDSPMPKLPRIVIFQAIQRTYAMAGITPVLLTQAYPLNAKIMMGFLLLNIAAIFNLIFTLCYAQTFAEYTQSIYVFSLMNLLIFALLIIILKVDKLFEFFNECADIVNSSESSIRIWRKTIDQFVPVIRFEVCSNNFSFSRNQSTRRENQ